jgi:hypothetical protein
MSRVKASLVKKELQKTKEKILVKEPDFFSNQKNSAGQANDTGVQKGAQ